MTSCVDHSSQVSSSTMLNYSRFSTNGRWNYGPFWEQVLDNPELPLPDWSDVRHHIHSLLSSLRSNLLGEARKYMCINFRPFRPVHHPLLPGELPRENERRSQFSSLEYFFSIYKQIEKEVSESCYREGLQAVISNLPRLRSLLEAIVRIIHHKKEDTSSLDQLAASVQALGGWDKARAAVDVHVGANQGSGMNSVQKSGITVNTEHPSTDEASDSSSPNSGSITEDSSRTSDNLSSCCSTLTDLELNSDVELISDFEETEESVRSSSSSSLESLTSATSDHSSVKESKFSLTSSSSYYEDIEALAATKATITLVPASLPTVSPLCCIPVSRWELDLAWNSYSSCLEPKKAEAPITKEKIDRVIEDCEKDNTAAFDDMSARYTPLEFSPMFDVINMATLLDRNTSDKEEISMKRIIAEMNSNLESDIAAIFGEAAGEKRVAIRA